MDLQGLEPCASRLRGECSSSDELEARVGLRWWQARVLPPARWGYGPLLSAGSPASMGRPSGIEPDLPGPQSGVLPLPLRPPWSTRRESNPQPSVCKTAARPVELLVVCVGHLGVEPSDPRVSGGCLHRLARARHVGPGGFAPPSPGFRPGACAVSATGPRWNGTWVLPPLLLVGGQLCICQHLSRWLASFSTRSGPSDPKCLRH